MFRKLLKRLGYYKIITPVEITFDRKTTKVKWSDGTYTIGKSKHNNELPAIKVSRCFMKKHLGNDYIGTINDWIKTFIKYV